MFSRTFDCPGFDGNRYNETWWFNLSDAELLELELGNVGGLDGMMKRMLRENKPDKVVMAFKTLILKAVGERTADGRRFIKKEHPGMPWGDVAEDFKETPAYTVLFKEILDPDNFKEFILKAVSSETADKLRKAEAEEAAKAANSKPESTETEESKIISIPTIPDGAGEPDAP